MVNQELSWSSFLFFFLRVQKKECEAKNVYDSWNAKHLPCKWMVSSPDGKSIYKKLRQLTVSRGIVGIGGGMSPSWGRLHGA